MGIATVLEDNERLRRELAAREAELADRDEKIALLTASNEDLARKLELIRLKTAGRKNERYVENATVPLPFVFEMPSPPPRLPEPDPPAATPTRSADPQMKSGHPRRRVLTSNTTRPTRTLRCAIDPASRCGRCGKPWRVFGTTHSARLEWVPGHFETLDIARERAACPDCPGEGVVIAPAPSFALPGAMCGNGLLARVIVDKFADNIPLNRQVTRMQREGETLAVATLCDWVAGAAKLLSRVADAIDQRLLAGAWLQADDTGLPVQDGLDGQCRKGRLWAVTDQQEVRYHFTATKEGKNPAAFLAKFKGKLLLVDGGSEFNEAVRQRGLLRAGCWSHLRRYFFDARHHFPGEAHLALGTLRDLFAIDAGLKGAPLDTVRAVRDTDARPLVTGFFDWLDGLARNTRPTSSLGEAIGYARNGKETFLRFLDHPELPFHNNRAELALRGPVVGRKGWLFAGSEGGAQAAAVLFSLTGSCMLQGVEPWSYLADVLTRLPDHPVNRVHELTPRAWRLAREGGAIG